MSNIQEDLEILCKELKSYYILRRKVIEKGKTLTSEETKEVNRLHDLLATKVGAFKDLISHATGIPKTGQEDIWVNALTYSTNALVTSSLDQVIQAVSLAIGKVKRDIELEKRDAQTGELLDKSGAIKSKPPKAFIAHEGITGVLTRLREFLEALGVEYLVAEIEASNGRGVEKQVQWTQGKADFAIILATKGRAIDKKTGESYMGLNVADELGRAREVFKNHIILLLQRGVKPHTNISGIIYEPFSPQNLEKPFMKIIKELRNWGFIQAAKT